MTDSTHKRYNSRCDIRNAGKMPALDVQHAQALYEKVADLPTKEALKAVWDSTIPGAFSRKTKTKYALSRELFFVYIITRQMDQYGLRWCDLSWCQIGSHIEVAPRFAGICRDCPTLLFSTPVILLSDVFATEVKQGRTFHVTMQTTMLVWTRTLRKHVNRNIGTYDAAASLVHFFEH